MIAEGDYTARVARAWLGFDNFGREAACVNFVITDGPEVNSAVTWSGGFEGEWMARTLRSLRAVGWTGMDLETISGLIDHEASITIRHKPGKNGKTYLQVFVNPRKAMRKDEAQGFARRMAGQIAAFEAEESAEAAPPPAAVDPTPVVQKQDVAPLPLGAPIDEDDIPFALLASLGGALSLFGLVSMGA